MMLSRIAIIAVCAAGVALCAASFNAASSLGRGLALAHTAYALRDATMRMDVLHQAGSAIEGAWSRPLYWHADAMEARSWIAANEAEARGGDRERLGQSAALAARSASAGPLNPIPWTRLAALDSHGIGNPLCNAADCIERSFAAAEVVDFDEACIRIRTALDAGAIRGDDARLAAFGRLAGVSNRSPRPCLSTAAPEAQFQVMLTYEASRRR